MSQRSEATPDPLARRGVRTRTIGDLPRLHLASTSPRRRELLTTAGILHDAANPGLDDAQLAPGSVDPERWVMALAYLKASSALRTPGKSPRRSWLGRTRLSCMMAAHRAHRLIWRMRGGCCARFATPRTMC